ncbi:MAG: bifunctional metallophosphatase/5'-nucleotidase [Saprospiraceae bacterium]|nr:bifunctional metallophosphatase/5'-nucleotidase [Saprospiraceae bacterium]
MIRRDFLQRMASGGMLLSAGKFPMHALGNSALPPEIKKITILHTNDVHSRIDPFPMDGGRNEGRGGVVRRGALIDSIRREGNPVLLLDAGDFFQGTPYFNLFGGEIELKAMSALGYDAATIGNHDFDGGIDGLANQMHNANFPLISSNYDFSDTVLHDKVKPFKVFTFEEIKVGVFGLGIELRGLVPQTLYKATRYLDPVKHAADTAKFLRKEMGCQYVVCMSHLGFKYQEEKISDVSLASLTNDIDLIIGGHTHTFLRDAELVPNQDKSQVVVNQVGWGGIRLGRIDVFFEKNRPGRCEACQNLKV